MPRRPAKNTQADIARALRAAKETGAGNVTLEPDGSIVIGLAPPSGRTDLKALDEDRVIPL
jgi:hypothetical protein